MTHGMCIPRQCGWFSLRYRALLGVTALLAGHGAAYAQEAKVDISAFGKAGADCAKLLSTDFSTTEDAPAQITKAMPIKGSGAKPDYCEVEGYVWRNVQFRIQFPLTGWNSKLVVVGTGGQSGQIAEDDSYGQEGSRRLLERGFAFMGHNSGHFSSLDSKWAYHNEAAMIDYGFRSVHVTAVIGKAILARYFGYRPKKSYFHSCSNGGREALMMPQRYPWTYDGVIAGAPSMDYSNLVIHLYWLTQLLKDHSRSGMDSIAAAVLHKAVLSQCDKLDGIADGLLEDPRQCKVNFAPIACKRGAAEDCLTEHQIDIARKIYQGPRRADGSQIATTSAFPGSELTWDGWTSDAMMKYPADMMRYMGFSPPPGPGWEPDIAKLSDYYKRMGLMDALYAPTNPDLRKFKQAGGKLIIVQGWNDAAGGVQEPMAYYDTVERIMGGKEKTQDFFRLFMVPGMNHCDGGDGVSTFDYIGALDKWVEKDEAPAVLTGYHPNPDGTPKFTRSIKPYRSTEPR